jgi:Fuc2NAc and GlcNAc transferase
MRLAEARTVTSFLICLLVPLIAAALLTGWARQAALSRGVLDVPNTRSSHTRPTARGGGLAIVIVVLASTVLLWAMGLLDTQALLGSAAGGLMIATVGYVDDVRGLSARYRFVVHLAAAALLAVTTLRAADTQPLLAGIPYMAVTAVLLMAGTVWSINLFNFMDGIDGIAASQSLFVAGASVLLAGTASQTPWEMLSLTTAAASLGFLLWNWPPAKIFMGDVGSGFLGFWLAAAALGLHVEGTLGIWTSITLGAMFFADATATLVRRVLRGERWYEAHRSHAYQILSRRWQSHLKVTGLAWLVNLAVVLPLAYLSVVWAGAAAWIALGLIGTLAIGCAMLGAGGQNAA